MLAGFYALHASGLVGASLAFTDSANGKLFEAMIGVGVFTLCAGPFALMLGILPGTILGALGGLIIALLVAPFRRHLSHRAVAMNWVASKTAAQHFPAPLRHEDHVILAVPLQMGWALGRFTHGLSLMISHQATKERFYSRIAQSYQVHWSNR